MQGSRGQLFSFLNMALNSRAKQNCHGMSKVLSFNFLFLLKSLSQALHKGPRLTLHCSVGHFPTTSFLADFAVVLLTPLLFPKTCLPCFCLRAFTPTMTSAWNVSLCSALSLTLGQTSRPHNLKFQILAACAFPFVTYSLGPDSLPNFLFVTCPARA